MQTLTLPEMRDAQVYILTELTKHFPNMAIDPTKPLPKASFSIVSVELEGITVGGWISKQAGEIYNDVSGSWSLGEVRGYMVFGRRWHARETLNVHDITQELLTLFYCEKLAMYMLD